MPGVRSENSRDDPWGSVLCPDNSVALIVLLLGTCCPGGSPAWDSQHEIPLSWLGVSGIQKRCKIWVKLTMETWRPLVLLLALWLWKAGCTQSSGVARKLWWSPPSSKKLPIQQSGDCFQYFLWIKMKRERTLLAVSLFLNTREEQINRAWLKEEAKDK